MIDARRVSRMTKLTEYEKQNKGLLDIARNYYRTDYIGIQLLKNLIRFTVAYLVGFALWACYSLDSLMLQLNKMEVKGLIIKIAVSYGVLLLLFLVLSYIMHLIRYFQAQRILQNYKNMLQRLENSIEKTTAKHDRKDTRTRHRNQGGTTDDGTFRI